MKPPHTPRPDTPRPDIPRTTALQGYNARQETALLQPVELPLNNHVVPCTPGTFGPEIVRKGSEAPVLHVTTAGAEASRTWNRLKHMFAIESGMHENMNGVWVCVILLCTIFRGYLCIVYDGRQTAMNGGGCADHRRLRKRNTPYKY